MFDRTNSLFITLNTLPPFIASHDQTTTGVVKMIQIISSQNKERNEIVIGSEAFVISRYKNNVETKEIIYEWAVKSHVMLAFIHHHLHQVNTQL